MPHWDADAPAALLRRHQPWHDQRARRSPAARCTTIELNAPLGFAMPVAGSDVRVCGEGNDLIAVDGAGDELGRLPIEPGLDGNRMNEGKPDPRGTAVVRIDVEDARARAGRAATGSTASGSDADPHDHDRQRHRLGRRARADVPRRLADPADRRVRLRRRRPARSRTCAPWVTIDPADGLARRAHDRQRGLRVAGAVLGRRRAALRPRRRGDARHRRCRHRSSPARCSAATTSRRCSSPRRSTGSRRRARRSATGRRDLHDRRRRRRPPRQSRSRPTSLPKVIG